MVEIFQWVKFSIYFAMRNNDGFSGDIHSFQCLYQARSVTERLESIETVLGVAIDA